MKILRQKAFGFSATNKLKAVGGAAGVRDKVGEAAEELGRKLGKAYKQTKSKLTSAGTEVKNKVGDVAEELGYKLGKATKWVKKNPGKSAAIGATVAAAGAGYGAYKHFKNKKERVQ